MEPFRFHLFICQQKKPEGAPSCPGRGAQQTMAALRREIKAAGLNQEVQVTECGCLGLCSKGPNLIVYPEGVWYTGVTAEDVPEIVSGHLKNGKPVERLAGNDPSALKKQIIEHDRAVARIKKIMDEAGFLPEEANALMRGFMESRIMLTAIELDLFTAVASGAEAPEAAKRINADPRATETLLNALAATGMMKKREGVFQNTEPAERFLVQGATHDSRMAAMHVVQLWPRWSTLTECVKKGTSVARERGETRDQAGTRAFIAAMHKNASFRAKQVVGALDLDGVNSVLDLGGGSGAYAMEFAKRVPEAEVTVFDLPTVIPLTEKYIEDEGMSGKIKTIKGDMLENSYRGPHDLVLVSAICHMFSPEENLGLFHRIKEALNPGGQVVIQDFVLDREKTSPRFGAVFALNMLVNTKGGGSYSGDEYVSWLEKAGFKDVRVLPLPGPTDLVLGRK
jgi:(2Fe-2S) ferredoxin/predicted O-methyltransferase YrrM